MTTFEENLTAEYVTHSNESLVQVVRRLEKERFANPRQVWLRKVRETVRMKTETNP